MATAAPPPGTASAPARSSRFAARLAAARAAGSGGGSAGGSGGGSAGGSGGDTCKHSECVTGKKLTDGCDACVTAVCDNDPFCCDGKWDAQCVSEAESCNPAPVCPVTAVRIRSRSRRCCSSSRRSRAGRARPPWRASPPTARCSPPITRSSRTRSRPRSSRRSRKASSGRIEVKQRMRSASFGHSITLVVPVQEGGGARSLRRVRPQHQPARAALRPLRASVKARRFHSPSHSKPDEDSAARMNAHSVCSNTLCAGVRHVST